MSENEPATETDESDDERPGEEVTDEVRVDDERETEGRTDEGTTEEADDEVAGGADEEPTADPDEGTVEGADEEPTADPDDPESLEARVEDLEAEYEDDPEVVGELASALADAVAEYVDRKEGDDAEPHLDRLEELYDEHAEEAVGTALARAEMHYCIVDGRNDEFDRLEQRVQRVQDLHDEYTSEDTAGSLAKALAWEAEFNVHGRDDGGDLDVAYQNLQFADSLSNQFHGTGVAEGLAAALEQAAWASFYEDDRSDMERKIQRIEGVIQQHGTPYVAEALASGLITKAWADGFNGEFDEMESEIERARELYEEYGTDRLAELAAHHRRNGAVKYFDNEMPEEAARMIDGIPELPFVSSNYDSVAGRMASALDRAVEYHYEHDDPEAANGALERLRELHADHPDDTRGSMVDAIEREAETAIEAGDLDTAEGLVAEIHESIEEAEGDPVETRLTAAGLETRIDAARGEMGADREDLSASIEDDEDGVVVTVEDAHGIEHRVALTDEGNLRNHEVEGLESDFDDLTELQEMLVGQAREFARDLLTRERDVDAVPVYERVDRLEAAMEAVDSLDDEAFDEFFGDYVTQHASGFAEHVPFFDAEEPPVDISEFDDDEMLLFEIDVYLEDGEVVATSDVGVSISEDEQMRTVQETTGGPDRDPDARVGIDRRPLFRTSHARDQVVEHLRCQVRDRYLLVGLQPPEEYRVVGWGTLDLALLLGDVDGVPDVWYHGEDAPGYESGLEIDEYLFEQLDDLMSEKFDDRSRSISSAYEAAPDANLVPEYEYMETTTIEGGE